MPNAVLDVDFPWLEQEIVLRGEIFHVRRPRVWQSFPGANLHGTYNYALVCPWCLQAWAKFDTDGDAPVYQIFEQVCDRCPPSRGVAGSLLDHDPILVDYLPDTLLWREVALHFKWLEKEESNGEEKKVAPAGGLPIPAANLEAAPGTGTL